nr:MULTISPECIES: diversity-generating retroelement protein Avd [unclassified Archaeoglobus]
MYKKAYDLTLYLLPLSEKFPKPQQHNGLASELRKTLLDMLMKIVEANNSKSVIAHEEIDASIEKLKIILRLSKDLKYISIKQYEHASKMLIEIGKMNGGWLKANTS